MLNSAAFNRLAGMLLTAAGLSAFACGESGDPEPGGGSAGSGADAGQAASEGGEAGMGSAAVGGSNEGGMRTGGAGDDAGAGGEAHEYSVTYLEGDADTGSAPTDDATYAEGEEVEVLDAPGLGLTGHSFAGWAGMGDLLLPGDVFAMGDGDVTLTAEFALNDYAVTYDGNGHTAGTLPAAMDYPFGSEVTVAPKGDLARLGYTFASWSLPGTGPLDPGSTFTLGDGPAALFAVWTPNQYNVTFDKNDDAADGSMAGQPFTFGSPGPLNLVTFTHDTMVFDGWAESEVGPVAYLNGGTYSVAAQDTTLYARWSEFRVLSVAYVNGSLTQSVWDQGDRIVITFSHEVDPTSIHASLTKGGTILNESTANEPWVNCDSVDGNVFQLINGDTTDYHIGTTRVEGTGTVGASNDAYVHISLDASGTILSLERKEQFFVLASIADTSDTNYIAFTPSASIKSASGVSIVVEEVRPPNGSQTF